MDVVELLSREFDQFGDVIGRLGEADWRRETDLPGWDVQACVAHVVGTEMMLAGHEMPSTEVAVDTKHVKNAIGEANERWVLHYREIAPGRLVSEYEAVVEERLTALHEMGSGGLNADSWTPRGPGTYRDFMEIRVFDVWMHEQDIRRAIGIPGHLSGPVVERALDEIEGALGFVVGKKVGAAQGSSAVFVVTGEREISVLVDGRTRVVEALDGPADVRIEMGAELFTMLAGGRTSLDHLGGELGVEITGDGEFGRRILDEFAIVI